MSFLDREISVPPHPPMRLWRWIWMWLELGLCLAAIGYLLWMSI